MSLALRSADILDTFVVPEELEATAPPEFRGLERDQVPLLVAEPGAIRHRRFCDLGDELRPGDLLVVNNSATIPAAIDIDGETVVHFSTELPGGLRVIEVRHRFGNTTRPALQMVPGNLPLPDGGTIELLAPFPVDSPTRRLWVSHLDGDSSLRSLLSQWGRPISYAPNHERFPIGVYQTVFAADPGSAEMPSAGRPFSTELVASLVSRGIGIVPLTLHAGVSSLETGEPPYPEWFHVPEATSDRVNRARAGGGRVIAVGTTVVRALETVSDSLGVTHPGRGWTDLHINQGTPVRSVDGVVTGWHEPRSTHLDMLLAIADRTLVAASYEAAIHLGYLWHEFGDSHLIWSERA